jgi:hypothetical protein
MRRTFTGVLGTIALSSAVALLAASPLAQGASMPKPHFKAAYWTVAVVDSTGYAAPHRVKPGHRYTLCNMDRLSYLQIAYSYRNTVTHGHPYTLVIAGPGGSERVRFGTTKGKSMGYSDWGAGALPPMFTTPTEAGRYTVTIRQGARTLMRAAITLASDNTCS